MGRPPLEIGQHGKINTRDETKPGGPESWRAYANHRDADGVTRRVEKWAETEEKAKTALRKALRERGRSLSGAASATTLGEVARVWLADIERKRADTTYARYESLLRTTVLPGVGKLRLRECAVGRLQEFMDALAYRPTKPLSASTLRIVRAILRGVLNMAQHQGLIMTNPAKDLNRIEGTSRPAKAFTAEQLRDFLAALDADKRSRRYDLPDLMRFLFGTGCRIGEALGLRWRDVNLSDKPITVDGEEIPPRSIWINGNIVYVTGKGIVRHDGKTFAARRMIELPEYLQLLLSMRQPITNDPNEPVFPNGTLDWRSPKVVQQSIRRMRERIGGYEEFTSHVGRKTVATALDKAGQTAREIADILGHAKVSTTQNRYLARGHANPAAAAALDALHKTA